jgi:hypothetical protein
MKVSQELEDKLVGIAVVKGHWYATACWLQGSGLLPTSQLSTALYIVRNIAAKHSDLHLPMFSGTLDLLKYVKDHVN